MSSQRSSDRLTYLVHQRFHRALTPDEAVVAIQAKHTIVVMDKHGQPKHITDPLVMGSKTSEELIELWRSAAADGRVFLVWAGRWTTAEELPPMSPLDHAPAESH